MKRFIIWQTILFFCLASAWAAAPKFKQIRVIVDGELSDIASGDFNNDGIVDSTEQNPSYIYSVDGTNTVKLTVFGHNGNDIEIKSSYITGTKQWVYDPDWWQKERFVWYFGQRLHSSSQQHYYDAMTQTGVGAVSWMDLRFVPDWEKTLGYIIIDSVPTTGIPLL